MSTKEMRDALEGMIDTDSLANVLDAISEVCLAKADHLASNWQDAGAAKAWEKAAKRIATLAERTDYPYMIA